MPGCISLDGHMFASMPHVSPRALASWPSELFGLWLFGMVVASPNRHFPRFPKTGRRLHCTWANLKLRGCIPSLLWTAALFTARVRFDGWDTARVSGCLLCNSVCLGTCVGIRSSSSRGPSPWPTDDHFSGKSMRRRPSGAEVGGSLHWAYSAHTPKERAGPSVTA